MLLDALQRTLDLSARLGVHAVNVDALHEESGFLRGHPKSTSHLAHLLQQNLTKVERNVINFVNA